MELGKLRTLDRTFEQAKLSAAPVLQRSFYVRVFTLEVAFCYIFACGV